MQMDWSFVILPYSDLWRRKRKLMHAHVHAGVATRYHPVQVHSARRFALDILTGEKTEEALPSAVRLYVGRTIIKAVYGIDVKDEEDEFVRYPEAVVQNFNIVLMPGRFMIDFFPLCE
jgi:cytochrome P450